MKNKKENPAWEKTKEVLCTIGRVLKKIGEYIFKFRAVLMAAPVVYAAMRLAAYARQNLPEQVGINLLSSGEFAMTINRSLAVTAPLTVTGACLVLMLFSRKALYPWAISIFTLVLPLLILFSNLYPA